MTGKATKPKWEQKYPCPHGCDWHKVDSTDPRYCHHRHSPDEWGHPEQKHNAEYWKAIVTHGVPEAQSEADR